MEKKETRIKVTCIECGASVNARKPWYLCDTCEQKSIADYMKKRGSL